MNAGIFGLPSANGVVITSPADTPPICPNPMNEEFTDAYAQPPGSTINAFPLPSWVSIGTAATTGIWMGRPKGLFLRSAAANSMSAAAYERPLPSGTWCVAAKVHNTRQFNWNPSGIFVRSSVSGRRAQLNIYQRANIFEKWVQTERYSAIDTRQDIPAEGPWYLQHAYLRICFDGTTHHMQVSPDGVWWTTAYTETQSTWFTGGNIPDRFGFCLKAENATIAGEAFFHWIRVFNEPFPMVGRDLSENFAI